MYSLPIEKTLFTRLRARFFISLNSKNLKDYEKIIWNGENPLNELKVCADKVNSLGSMLKKEKENKLKENGVYAQFNHYKTTYGESHVLGELIKPKL